MTYFIITVFYATSSTLHYFSYSIRNPLLFALYAYADADHCKSYADRHAAGLAILQLLHSYATVTGSLTTNSIVDRLKVRGPCTDLLIESQPTELRPDAIGTLIAGFNNRSVKVTQVPQ